MLLTTYPLINANYRLGTNIFLHLGQSFYMITTHITSAVLCFFLINKS